MAFLPISRIDEGSPAAKLPVVLCHRKAKARMPHIFPPNDRSSRSPLDRRQRRFGDVNAVLLALAIGLAVLDGTCFAAFKLIHVVAPLIHTLPGIDQPWVPPGARAGSG
jgi:hypothetical protein